MAIHKETSHHKPVSKINQQEDNRRKLDELASGHRKELKNFWSAISIEEKWCLTEMSTGACDT